MFESSNRITLLCKSDYSRLLKLVTNVGNSPSGFGRSHPKLETATVVEDHMLPDDTAKIGSLVSLKDLGTGSVARLLLSGSSEGHPNNSEGPRVVSVTSSLGIALLGTRVGEQIKWTLPNGHTRYLRVSELTTKVAVC